MFRMELNNCQILQLLSVAVYSILAYALCFQSVWYISHVAQDVTGLNHMPFSALRTSVVSHPLYHPLSFGSISLF